MLYFESINRRSSDWKQCWCRERKVVVFRAAESGTHILLESNGRNCSLKRSWFSLTHSLGSGKSFALLISLVHLAFLSGQCHFGRNISKQDLMECDNFESLWANRIGNRSTNVHPLLAAPMMDFDIEAERAKLREELEATMTELRFAFNTSQLLVPSILLNIPWGL